MIKIDIRWSDLDANRHLANSAYVNFMSYARVREMKNLGISHDALVKFNLGPVVLHEHIYYFKEVLPDQTVFVEVLLDGLSQDGMFFSFSQNMYDENGKNTTTYEMFGAWIDMSSRKLVGLPDELIEKFHLFKFSKNFKTLTREDTRKFNKRPQHIDRSSLSKR